MHDIRTVLPKVLFTQIVWILYVQFLRCLVRKGLCLHVQCCSHCLMICELLRVTYKDRGQSEGRDLKSFNI